MNNTTNTTGKTGADLVVYGKIFTSEDNKIVEAFAVKDGKYVYVGDKKGAEEDMRKLLELNPGELEGATGEYQAEGVEKMMKRAYSAINPFGI